VAISKNLLDRQHNSHIENPIDGGDDRRVNDSVTHQKIDELKLISTPVGLIDFIYDFASLVEESTTDTWTYKTGGAGGTIVKTITIEYTTSSKNTIQDITKV